MFYTTDFEVNSHPEWGQGLYYPGYSPNFVMGQVPATGNTFLYNSSAPCEPSRLFLTDLPPHTTVSIGFLLGLLGTWDGIGGSPGPDRFNVTVDGRLVFSHVFGIPSGSGTNDYTPAGAPLISVSSGPYISTGIVYDLGLEPELRSIPHTARSLTVEWYANGPGWQGGTDEGWGIDNVQVSLQELAAPPAITGLTPIDGLVGDSVVVAGVYSPLATGVSFNGTPATIIRASDSSVTALVPAGATTGPITVSNALGSATSSQVFTVHQVPVITSISPNAGSLGSIVVVRGSNLNEIARFRFGNGAYCPFDIISGSELRVTVNDYLSGPAVAEPVFGPPVSGPTFTYLEFDPNPHFEAIYDVPRDQGGHVFLTWRPSDYDRKYYGRSRVSGYRVWRRAMPSAAPSASAVSAGAGDRSRTNDAKRMWRTNLATGALEYWEALATLPSAFLSGYAYQAETTQDSLPGGAQFTAFMLQTVPLSNTSTEFYFSPVDSGYSVDNLPPRAPLFAGARYDAGQNHLHWLPNTEADLNGYILYRGTHPDFVIDVTDPVAFVADTGYVDAAPGPMYYKIAAIDRHGNRSPYITVLPTGNAGVGGGLSLAFGLGRAFPNPSDGSSLKVDFTLPSAAAASLEVLDVSGRCVLRDDLAGYAAGRHTIDLAARMRLASGLYVVRLKQSGLTRTIRATVLK